VDIRAHKKVKSIDLLDFTTRVHARSDDLPQTRGAAR
jgi:hypothetical protein